MHDDDDDEFDPVAPLSDRDDVVISPSDAETCGGSGNGTDNKDVLAETGDMELRFTGECP
jgi:hypothetical protein